MINSNAPRLHEYPPFLGMADNAIRYLQSRLRRYHFRAGQVIIEFDKRGQFMAIIENGEMMLETGEGDRRLLKAGDAFGEEMLFVGEPSASRVVARMDASLWVLERKDLLIARNIPDGAPPAPAPRRSPSRLRPWVIALVAILMTLVILSPEWIHFVNRKLNDLFLSAGRPDMAEAFLEFAVRLTPVPAQEYDSLGYALYLQGKQSEALAAFEEAVQRDPELASAQGNLGVALLQQADERRAVEHLQKAVDLDPGRAEVYFNLGNALLAVDDPQAAAIAYRRAFDLDPNQIEAKIGWAGIQMLQGELELAQSAWEQVLLAEPGNALAMRGLGVIAVLEQQPSQALPNLLAARLADPLDASTHFYIGLALEALDNPAEAAISYEQAVALSDDPQLKNLAKANVERLQQ